MERVSEVLRVTQLTNLARIGALNQTSPCFPLALRLRKLTDPTLENKSALCTASLQSSLHLFSLDSVQTEMPVERN